MKAPGDPAPYVTRNKCQKHSAQRGPAEDHARGSRRRAITPSLGVKPRRNNSVIAEEWGAWCAARGLAPQAQAKIEKELQSRLDESLARAIQEQEGGGAAAAVPDDVC